MRKLLTLFTALLFVGSMWADPVTIFYEDFGEAGNATSAYSAYNHFSAANSQFTSGTAKTNYTGDGTVGKSTYSAANLSSGYTGASGLSGCYQGGVANTEKTVIIISNIKISGYSNLHLSFGALGGSTDHKVTVTYKIDSGSETTLINNGAITNANWTLKEADIPGDGTSLMIKIKHTPTKAWTIRVDDIKITGEVAGPSVVVKPTSLAFGTVDQHASVAAKSFKLKGANLTAGIKLTAPTGYTVSPDTLTETQAMNADSVTITVTPSTENAGTFNNNLTIVSCKATPEFTTVNVPLSMSVTANYAINTTGDGGSFAWEASLSGSGSPAYVKAGETVIITATPDGNHTFGSLSFSDNVTDEDIAENIAEFTMPAGDVTVTAVFNEKTSASVSVSANKLDWGRVAKGAELSGKPLTITGKNLTGTLSLAWDELGDQAFNFSVTSGSLTPDANKDVSATITVTPKSTANVAKFSDILQITGGGLAQAEEKEVEMDLNVLQTYTVTWNINGAEKHSQTDTAGVTLASIPDATLASNGAIHGKEFKGWAEAAIVGEVEAGDAGIVVTPTVMPAADKDYYAVYALKSGDDEPVLRQTLQYDTWTYSGTTTDKDSYRLFAENAYIESASFDLSTLTQVNVYAGTYGTLDNNKKKVTITDGTTTWKSCTLSTSSATTKNTVTNGTALTGTGTLRIVAGGGNGSGTGIRISKVEIYNQIPITYSKYATNGSCVVVDPASLELGLDAVDDGVISVTYTNADPANAVVATYSDTTCVDTLDGGWLRASLNGEKNIVYDADAATYVVKKAYVKLTVPSASAGIATEATIIIPVSQAKKDPVFSSLEELAASDLPNNTSGVSVTFNNRIDSFYLYKGDTAGVYLNVTKEGRGIRIYRASETTINTWRVNGTLSGTMTSTTWKYIEEAWQVTAANAFQWSSLTYTAPDPTAIEDVAIENKEKAVKVLRNGVLYIEKAGKVYTITGQLVK